MVKFVGGTAQAGYVDQVRGVDPAKCLVVPVDVGKRSAVALVANHHGEVVADPVEFELTMSGTTQLLNVVKEAESKTHAESVRIGVEDAPSDPSKRSFPDRAGRFEVSLPCCA